MAWYIVCFAIGIIIGYIIKDLMPADIQYKGKIRQKGENNRIIIDRGSKSKRKRLIRKNKDKK